MALWNRVESLLRTTREQVDHWVTAVARNPGMERLKIDAAFWAHEGDRLLDKLGVSQAAGLDVSVSSVVSGAIDRLSQLVAVLAPSAATLSSGRELGHESSWDHGDLASDGLDDDESFELELPRGKPARRKPSAAASPAAPKPKRQAPAAKGKPKKAPAKSAAVTKVAAATKAAAGAAEKKAARKPRRKPAS